MKFSDRLVHSWYNPQWFNYLLWPLSCFYRLISAVRRLCYHFGIFKSTRFDVPVVVVGNLTVGGTGKTPCVIALVSWLQQQGLLVGVVARGYGGALITTPQQVCEDSNPHDVGDEAVLIVQRTRAPMVVAANRVAAVRLLLEQHNCDVVITDDGLQHYALERDIEIVVIDALRQMGNGMCLPAGPLREPASRLKSVDFCVFHGNAPKDSYSFNLVAEPIYNCAKPELMFDKTQHNGQDIHAVAGIGHPARFFNSLRAQGLTIIEHPFKDHHQFQQSDIDFDGVVLMTEKDAVKCARFVDQRHWCCPVRAQLDSKLCQHLIARMR